MLKAATNTGKLVGN